MGQDDIHLFTYKVFRDLKLAREVICRYTPGYGYTCNKVTTNGSWSGMYHALYELDPNYVKMVNCHAYGELSIDTTSVPDVVLSAANGFMTDTVEGRNARIKKVADHFSRILRDTDFKKNQLDERLLEIKA